MAIDERNFFTDRLETRAAPLSCPKCRRRFEIPSHQSLVFL